MFFSRLAGNAEKSGNVLATGSHSYSAVAVQIQRGSHSFCRGTSTVDLLKAHNSHRPLGSGPGRLLNTQCLHRRAQRNLWGQRAPPNPKKWTCSADDGCLWATGQRPRVEMVGLITVQTPGEQAAVPVGSAGRSAGSCLLDHTQEVNAFHLHLSYHSPNK